jgi:hypothetical protein
VFLLTAENSFTGIRPLLPILLILTCREGGTSKVPFQDRDHGKTMDCLAMIFFLARCYPRRLSWLKGNLKIPFLLVHPAEACREESPLDFVTVRPVQPSQPLGRPRAVAPRQHNPKPTSPSAPGSAGGRCNHDRCHTEIRPSVRRSRAPLPTEPRTAVPRQKPLSPGKNRCPPAKPGAEGACGTRPHPLAAPAA